ncbi:MAG: hypothetical protein MJZ25_03515, partial [Fibrobacter sp.]|nr:hypothetical protein [Fibrobacter sp.]
MEKLKNYPDQTQILAKSGGVVADKLIFYGKTPFSATWFPVKNGVFGKLSPECLFSDYKIKKDILSDVFFILEREKGLGPSTPTLA